MEPLGFGRCEPHSDTELVEQHLEPYLAQVRGQERRRVGHPDERQAYLGAREMPVLLLAQHEQPLSVRHRCGHRHARLAERLVLSSRAACGDHVAKQPDAPVAQHVAVGDEGVPRKRAQHRDAPEAIVQLGMAELN